MDPDRSQSDCFSLDDKVISFCLAYDLAGIEENRGYCANGASSNCKGKTQGNWDRRYDYF